ncbi:MAG TPA: type I-C CRISPR-associated protein Cas7/Csd2 [Tepidisphaeraceae bacterium]
MNTSINKRYDFVLLYDVINGNPNGDPDAGNSPRIDPETGYGLVSDVCLKRKIRNYIALTQSDTDETGRATPKKGYDLYVKERAVLNLQHQRAYDALGLDSDAKAEKKVKGEKSKKPEGPPPDEQARQWMCQTFFDVRMFGAVMSTGVNAGQVRGPVQVMFSKSIDPIISLEQSITRMAVTTEEESEKQQGGNRTMGRKEIVPYGLYRCHGFVSANLAKQTGFSEADLNLLWQALINLFEHDRSAARGEMASQRLFVFEHESALGNYPAHKLFEKVKFEKTDPGKPARSFADYQQVDGDGLTSLPTGVTLREMI